MVAVITGGASRIGRASAIRLADDGADIAVLDIDAHGLDETAALVEATGRRVVAVGVDLHDRRQITAAFDTVKADLGPVTILLNNAGGAAVDEVRTFRKSTYEQWDRMTTLNLRQAVDCTREVIDDMVESRYGRIINTSSEMAFRAGLGMTDYSAAKAGLLGFTRSLANEVGRYGVTVNAVCPGATRTAARGVDGRRTTRRRRLGDPGGAARRTRRDRPRRPRSSPARARRTSPASTCSSPAAARCTDRRDASGGVRGRLGGEHPQAGDHPAGELVRGLTRHLVERHPEVTEQQRHVELDDRVGIAGELAGRDRCLQPSRKSVAHTTTQDDEGVVRIIADIVAGGGTGGR